MCIVVVNGGQMAKSSWHQFVAHCPHFGCTKPNQVIQELDQAERPVFHPKLCMTVVCSNCGRMFEELASDLDWIPKAK
jgi:C4-type Zn-finger protein